MINFEIFLDFFNENLFYFGSLFFFINFIFFIYNFFKKEKKNKVIFYSKIQPKKVWLSDLIKLLLYADQKDKNLYFKIYKSANISEKKNGFVLSAPINYELTKAFINGFEEKNIKIEIDIFNHIRNIVLEEENFSIYDDYFLIIYLCKNTKTFSVFSKDTHLISLSPSATIRSVENLLENKG